MRADYLGPWMALLLARLETGERPLARGTAFEPRNDSFELSELVSGPGCAVVVTQRRALWVSSSDQRWVRTLPFAEVRSYVELSQAHRYALVLDHEGMERLQWVPAHRFLGWSWGNAEALRPVRRSVLGFSRRDTAAARAIRMQLQARGVPAGEPRSLPRRERRHELPGQVRGRRFLALTDLEQAGADPDRAKPARACGVRCQRSRTGPAPAAPAAAG